jgi:PIN domain nuclease of toxin-antitoxin system
LKGSAVVLIDTHVWLWFISGDTLLAQHLRKRIENDCESILLSFISVWEAVVLAQKGRISVKGNPIEHFREALALVPLKQAPLSNEIALVSRSLKTKLNDPADLFIAATAIIYNVSLATSDMELKKIKEIQVVDAQE